MRVLATGCGSNAGERLDDHDTRIRTTSLLRAFAVALVGACAACRGGGALDGAGRLPAAVSFLAAPLYSAGQDPLSVVMGDLNGDGKTDLVVVDDDIQTDYAGHLRVLLKDGDGTLAPAVDYPVGSAPISLAMADLNGDGAQDLVAVSDDGTASVLLGAGNGTFAKAVDYAAGDRPLHLTVADLNGDERPDLVVSTDTGLNVLLNDGHGGFPHAVGYPSDGAPAPTAIAIGDLDGDGAADLATVTYGGLTVSVRLNDGLGAFASAAEYAVPSFPGLITLADLNGDGRRDLIVGGLHDLSVLLNRGGGTFADAVGQPGIVSLSSFTLADLNGDGSIDLAVDTLGNIDVLLNRGDGTFADGGVNSSIGDGQITTADLDGDGTNDLVVNVSSGGIVLLMNGGDATFANAGRYLAAGGGMAVLDLNGDGKPDLAVASYSEGVAVFLNDGDGTLAAAPVAPENGGSVALADLDGDGILDLAVSTDQGVAVAMGDGRGAFTKGVDYPLGSGPSMVAIGDLNGDGEPDLALPMFGGGAGSTVAVLLNEGRGAFGAPVEYAAGTVPAEIAMGDLDGDGRLDLAVENAGRTVGKSIEGAGVSVLLNRGDGSFSASVTYEAGLPAIGDLNGDGKADLVILRAMNGSGFASVRLNQGGGTLSAPVTYPTGSIQTSIGLADMDGDGHLDLVAGGHSVLFNKGDGTFLVAVSTMASGGAFAVGDLNGDGVMDLAVLNHTGGLSVLVGLGRGATSLAATYAASPGDSVSLALGDLNGDGKPDLVGAFNGWVAALANTSP